MQLGSTVPFSQVPDHSLEPDGLPPLQCHLELALGHHGDHHEGHTLLQSVT